MSSSCDLVAEKEEDEFPPRILFDKHSIRAKGREKISRKVHSLQGEFLS